jgi:hypothetical protein
MDTNAKTMRHLKELLFMSILNTSYSRKFPSIIPKIQRQEKDRHETNLRYRTPASPFKLIFKQIGDVRGADIRQREITVT